ncbi:50S ribosomal protein L29 [Candidatus Microgenomates bacterium]|nr:50S ribosomal protein L29 [Candidatus Microgenomates bacterium]
MKKKEFQQLSEKSVKDLTNKVTELKKKISMDYLKIRVGQEKNLRVVKNTRKELAQTLTVLASKVQKEGEKVDK